MSSDGSHVSVRNQDGSRPAGTFRQEPSTAAGMPALDVACDDPGAPVIFGKGGGTLLDLRDTSGVQKLKVDSSGNTTVAGGLALSGVLTGAGANPSGAEALASGEAICPRLLFGIGGVTLTTQVLLLSYWTAVTSGTATTVTTVTADVAASGLTLAKAGIYSVAANGDIALLASTADLHASLWTSTFTTYASSLSSNFTRVAGQRYAMGVLAVGTTPPHLSGPGSSSSYQLAPIMGATVTGQSDLPSAVAHGSVSANFQFVSAVVSP